MNEDRFKFRVWSTKEESYGGFFHDSASIHEDGHLSVHYWCKGEYATDMLGDGFEEGDYIIEQCTGLKDKNGRLIYEGDVILAYWGKKYYAKKFEVIWHMGRFWAKGLSHGDMFHLWDMHSEVIGNIHEERFEMEDMKDA